MKWITRKNANVDRIACPWLIRKFVDKDPVFLYVPPEEVLAVAKREDAIPYDVEGVELGHVGGRCSFESIMVKYNLTEPALQKLAKIVHGRMSPATSRSSQKPQASRRSPTASQCSMEIMITRRYDWRHPSTMPCTRGAKARRPLSGCVVLRFDDDGCCSEPDYLPAQSAVLRGW